MHDYTLLPGQYPHQQGISTTQVTQQSRLVTAHFVVVTVWELIAGVEKDLIRCNIFLISFHIRLCAFLDHQFHFPTCCPCTQRCALHSHSNNSPTFWTLMPIDYNPGRSVSGSTIPMFIYLSFSLSSLLCMLYLFLPDRLTDKLMNWSH